MKRAVSSVVNFSVASRSFCSLVRYSADAYQFSEDHKFKVNFDRPAASRRARMLLNLLCEFPVEINVRFCDVEEMREVNHRFRGKNCPTDVLSFPQRPMSASSSDEDIGAGKSSLQFIGDILICVPVCVWQAKRARHSLAEEIERMVVHGVAHLRGFDHERSESAWRVQTGLEKLLRRELTEAMGQPSWFQER